MDPMSEYTKLFERAGHGMSCPDPDGRSPEAPTESAGTSIAAGVVAIAVILVPAGIMRPVVGPTNPDAGRYWTDAPRRYRTDGSAHLEGPVAETYQPDPALPG
jgi:hypothetical protein